MTYTIKEDHKKIKEQIKGREKRIDNIIKSDIKTNKDKEEISIILEEMSHEMSAINN